jgi:hypothetical protein
MALYRIGEDMLEKVPETSFTREGVLERRHLQKLLVKNPSVIAPDLLVVAEEYGDWEDSNRRIDLLCLNKEAQLIVVELKRTSDGGHMELQAIRYAAMVSNMTFAQLVNAHARFLGGDDSHHRAEAALCAFLGWRTPDGGSISSGAVKIYLVSADFSREITTTVLWLNEHDLDITCVRIKPYRVGIELLVDAEQIIPLPEAEDYYTRIRDKEQEESRGRTAREEMFMRFWTQLISRSKGTTSVVAGRGPSKDNSLSGGIGVSGFRLTFVLRDDEFEVGCYIDPAKDKDTNLEVLRQLESHKTDIEREFGDELEWQELPESRGCRICKKFEGGSRTPEGEWPALQDKMIDAMIRLERALRPAIPAKPPAVFASVGNS